MRWRPGNPWAIVEGAADEVAGAFDVPVRDYRGRKGQVFYASPQQPDVPESLQGGVTSLAASSDTPRTKWRHRECCRWTCRATVHENGVVPDFIAGDTGTLELFGEPARNRTAPQIAEDLIEENHPDATVDYENDLALIAAAVGPCHEFSPRASLGREPATGDGHGQVRQQLRVAAIRLVDSPPTGGCRLVSCTH